MGASPASSQVHQAAVNQTGSPALVEVQGRLRSFLKQSSRYDARLVLARIRGSPLWQEQVLLHSKVSAPVVYIWSSPLLCTHAGLHLSYPVRLDGIYNAQ